MEQEQDRSKSPFRFLTHKEFAGLTQDERAKYLALALEAIRSGHPLDDIPIKDPPH